jgi:hypothetical protein
VTATVVEISLFLRGQGRINGIRRQGTSLPAGMRGRRHKTPALPLFRRSHEVIEKGKSVTGGLWIRDFVTSM